jgi:hypothetical protein
MFSPKHLQSLRLQLPQLLLGCLPSRRQVAALQQLPGFGGCGRIAVVTCRRARAAAGLLPRHALRQGRDAPQRALQLLQHDGVGGDGKEEGGDERVDAHPNADASRPAAGGGEGCIRVSLWGDIRTPTCACNDEDGCPIAAARRACSRPAARAAPFP